VSADPKVLDVIQEAAGVLLAAHQLAIAEGSTAIAALIEKAGSRLDTEIDRLGGVPICGSFEEWANAESEDDR